MAGAVLITSALAVCTTPALQHTPDYYRGLVGNEAARRGEGLWGPLSLTSGFDLLLLDEFGMTRLSIGQSAVLMRAIPRGHEGLVAAGTLEQTERDDLDDHCQRNQDDLRSGLHSDVISVPSAFIFR